MPSLVLEATWAAAGRQPAAGDLRRGQDRWGGHVSGLLVDVAADVPPDPRLGVGVRLLSAWKDFLWPLLVLPDPDVQPLSVRLPTLARSTELDVLLAALTISALIPMVLFLVCQRTFLRSAGLSGALKG